MNWKTTNEIRKPSAVKGWMFSQMRRNEALHVSGIHNSYFLFFAQGSQFFILYWNKSCSFLLKGVLFSSLHFLGDTIFHCTAPSAHRLHHCRVEGSAVPGMQHPRCFEPLIYTEKTNVAQWGNLTENIFFIYLYSCEFPEAWGTWTFWSSLSSCTPSPASLDTSNPGG